MVKPSSSHRIHSNNFHLECRNQFGSLSHHRSSEEDKPPSEGIKRLQNKSKIKSTSPENPSCTKKHSSQLIILSDSHGKDLSHRLESKTSVNVCAFVRPGAKFNRATEEVEALTKELKHSDHLLVIAGTNNIESTGVNRLINDITGLINSSQHTNLILATVPMIGLNLT